MYCSTCGAADQSVASYCRKCGEWLSDRNSRARRPAPGQKLRVISVFSGLNSLFALVSAIVLYATYLGTPEAKWSIYVAAAFCTVIAVHQAISFGFALSLIIRDRRRRIEMPPQEASRATGQLEACDASTSPFIDAQSVTENTTELLPAQNQADRARESQ